MTGIEVGLSFLETLVEEVLNYGGIPGLSMDDKMADGYTDARGYFQLSGTAREVSTIDPKLYIYHDCNDGWKVSNELLDPTYQFSIALVQPCQRRFGIMIPDKYITNGPVPRQFYDAGTIELAGKFSGETRDCIH